MKAKLIKLHSVFRFDVTHEVECKGNWQWQWIDPTRVALICDRVALELTVEELKNLKEIAAAASER